MTSTPPPAQGYRMLNPAAQHPSAIPPPERVLSGGGMAFPPRRPSHIRLPSPPAGGRTEIEGRRQVGLRNVDPDLGRIEGGAALDPVGHRSRPEDNDHNQNNLQEDPGDGSPVDFRSLDAAGRNAPQIKQRKAERRVHEARLNVGADEHAEPDQVDAEPISRRRQQGNDDERDLEEVEKERDHEDEGIDENEEADLPAGERRQQLLDPHLAPDSLEHQAEGTRTDQDIDDHGG